ncbi:MAG TPA: DUF2442 domain-containing protein [Acidobacteriaceae bacterium]
MVKHRVLTTDEQIDAALERAKHAEPQPRAKSATYSRGLDLLILELVGGRRMVFPREDLQGLQDATPKQLAKVELVGGGIGLHWEELDADLYVPALVKGVYGSQRWMAEIGSRGGKVSSGPKRTAARKNGAKGGRPRKQIAA